MRTKRATVMDAFIAVIYKCPHCKKIRHYCGLKVGKGLVTFCRCGEEVEILWEDVPIYTTHKHWEKK